MSIMDTPNIGEILALGDQLTAAGYELPDAFAKAAVMNQAISAALKPDPFDMTGLIEMDPAIVVRQLREAAFIRVAEQMLGNVHTGFMFNLSRSTRAVLHGSAGDIITAMREKWTPAVAIVQAAADAGLTKDTNPTELLSTGSTEAIEAFRNLAPAVRVLDEIRGLRDQLTTTGGVGPADHLVAAYVTGIDSPEVLATAGTILAGQKRWGDVQNGQFTNRALVPVPRLGGPWLTLIVEGIELRLNDGPEAAAVVEAANLPPAEFVMPGGMAEITGREIEPPEYVDVQASGFLGGPRR